MIRVWNWNKLVGSKEKKNQEKSKRIEGTEDLKGERRKEVKSEVKFA